VAATLPMAQVLALCRERELTRVPVVDPATKRINGLINLEHILYLDTLDTSKPAREYVQAAFFLPEELHLEVALRRMQHAGSRMAVVLSPDHRETGIISLQDILKVIFGEVTL
jgi:CBS domain containing-hemolysin-like protein